MLPNLLLRPRRVRADPQQRLHLRYAHKVDLPRHEPANTLSARRARQATLIRPKLIEAQHRVEKRVHGQGNRHFGGVAEGDHGRELREEG